MVLLFALGLFSGIPYVNTGTHIMFRCFEPEGARKIGCLSVERETGDGRRDHEKHDRHERRQGGKPRIARMTRIKAQAKGGCQGSKGE